MRVLHINPGNLYGGVETFLVTLARCRQLCQNMAPEFAVCFAGRYRDELATAGVPVHDLGEVRASRPWTVFSARRRLKRLLAGGRHSVAVCHQPWTQAIFGRTIERSPARHVAYFHGPIAGGGWVERLAARRHPSLVIAPSRDSLASARAMFPAAPGEVLNYPLPPGVVDAPELSTSERTDLRTSFGAGCDDAVVLQASRVERWKGPDVVLRALGRLRDVPGWKFWFAGGPQRPHEETFYSELRALATAEKIADRVIFLGPRTDVPRLMRAADIYCQGNRGPEGFSLAFLEASHCRLPIVTTDLGGAGEMIDPQTGVLVPPGDEALLAASLQKLITDPVRRRILGEAARIKSLRLCELSQQIQRLHTFLALTAESV